MADDFDAFDEFAAAGSKKDCGCGCSGKGKCTCGSASAETTALDGEDTGDTAVQESDQEMDALALRLTPLLRQLAPLAAEAIAADWEVETEDAEDGGGEDDEPAEEGVEDSAGLADEDEAMAQQLAADSAAVADDRAAECLAGGVVVQIFAPAPVEVKRVLPAVLHRTSRLVRFLRRRPRTRPFLRLLPSIERRTAAALVRRAKRGRRITRRTAVGTLRRQTARMFRSPRRVVRALRRNSARRRWLNLRAVARSERSA